MEQCTENRRFDNIEADITEIKLQLKANTTDIIQLKESSAETKVYVKQIFERIDDLKVLIKAGAQGNNDTWVKIVLELIKMVSIVAGIIAGVKLL